MYFFFFVSRSILLFYVLQKHTAKKEGNIFIDPSSYAINLLIANKSKGTSLAPSVPSFH